MLFTHSSFGKKLKQLLLLIFLSLSLVSAHPKPANAAIYTIAQGAVDMALSMIEFVKNYTQELLNYEWIMNTYNSLMEARAEAKQFADTADKNNSALIDAVVTTGEAEIKIQKTMEEAKMAADAMQHNLDRTAGAVAKETPPQDTNAQLCYSMTGYQGPEAMDAWVDAETGKYVRSIMESDRGPDADGMGVRRSAENWIAECGMQFGLKKDKVPDKCKNDSATSEAMMFQGVSILATTFFNSNIKLSRPLIDDSTHVLIIDKDSPVEEKNWYSAWRYIELLGIHPTPPSGKDLESPSGNPAYMNWEHCAAIQSKYIETLSRRLARITRPNMGAPTDDGMINVLAANMLSCDGLAKAGNVDRNSVENCTKYLSQVELERLAMKVCSTEQRTSDLAETGLNHGAIIGQGSDCFAARGTWQAVYKTEAAEFNAAVTGLHELRDCWSSKQ